jgi:protein AaeX
MHEFDLYGVLLPPILVWTLFALAIRGVLRRVLLRFNLYRFISHPALFDMSILVILIGGVAMIAIGLSPS